VAGDRMEKLDPAGVTDGTKFNPNRASAREREGLLPVFRFGETGNVVRIFAQ